jgi:hypothetical protein
MESQKLFEVRAYGKEKIPHGYYATPDELENKELRKANPATKKNRYGHYQSGRITAVRAE